MSADLIPNATVEFTDLGNGRTRTVTRGGLAISKEDAMAAANFFSGVDVSKLTPEELDARAKHFVATLPKEAPSAGSSVAEKLDELASTDAGLQFQIQFRRYKLACARLSSGQFDMLSDEELSDVLLASNTIFAPFRVFQQRAEMLDRE